MFGESHVNFGAQSMGAIGKLACPHPLKHVQVLLHGTVSIGTFLTRFGECSAVLPYLIGAQAADIGVAGFDELERQIDKAFRNNRRHKTDGLPSQIPASGRRG